MSLQVHPTCLCQWICLNKCTYVMQYNFVQVLLICIPAHVFIAKPTCQICSIYHVILVDFLPHCCFLSSIATSFTLLITRQSQVHPQTVNMSTNSTMSKHAVSSSNSSEMLMRIKAPVVLQWPWANGISLEHGSLTVSLREGIQTKGFKGEIGELVVASVVII